MDNYAGSPTVTNCAFTGNLASQSGGGMHNAGYHGPCNPTMTNCTFSGNSSPRGGGMMNGFNSPTLTNCTFSRNSATYGGGMWNKASNPTVTNCRFSGNSANSGGGMYSWDNSSPTLTNCTFSGNSTGYKGGGMTNISSSPTLTKCILWGDTAPIGPEIYNSGSTPTVTYSDIAGGYTGTGNINADPLFADADLRLSAGSPCIDAGDNSAVPAGVETDLDGNPRIVNGTVDMGAYEGEGQGPSIITVEIDIKPGSYPSSINLRNNGVTPVAIHTTGDFDATTVKPSTVMLFDSEDLLIGVEPVMWDFYDCDELPNPLYGDPLFPNEPEMIGDGDIDLALYFDTPELAVIFGEGTIEATITGETWDGVPLIGTGDVRIVSPKGKK